MRYKPIPERVFSGLAEVKQERARKVCASQRSKFAWMRFDVCTTVNDGPAKGYKVNGPEGAAEILRDLHNANTLLLQETVSVLLVNAQLYAIGFAVVSIGGTSAAMLDPQVVLRPAVLLPASGIFLCHNHPSGSARLSDADIQITEQLAKAAEFLGVKLMDHIILTQNAWFSFRNDGLLR